MTERILRVFGTTSTPLKSDMMRKKGAMMPQIRQTFTLVASITVCCNPLFFLVTTKKIRETQKVTTDILNNKYQNIPDWPGGSPFLLRLASILTVP